MWKDFYKDIVLTEEEKEEALFEAQKAKYFREYHAEYWAEVEKKKVGKTLDSHREKGKL